MKRNKFFTCFAAAVLGLAMLGITACDDNKSDKNESIYNTLDGKVLVMDCTEKVLTGYTVSSSGGTSATYTAYTVKNKAYIRGESDDLVTVYTGYPGGTTTYGYSAGYWKYHIDHNSITFTLRKVDGGERSYTANITSDSTFTVPRQFIDDDYAGRVSGIVDETLTFRIDSTPQAPTYTR